MKSRKVLQGSDAIGFRRKTGRVKKSSYKKFLCVTLKEWIIFLTFLIVIFLRYIEYTGFDTHQRVVQAYGKCVKYVAVSRSNVPGKSKGFPYGSYGF